MQKKSFLALLILVSSIGSFHGYAEPAAIGAQGNNTETRNTGKVTGKVTDANGEPIDKDGNYDYRARMSVAWDYDGCMYYQRAFRDIFGPEKWNTYWVLKYQNWQTQTDEPAPPMSSCSTTRLLKKPRQRLHRPQRHESGVDAQPSRPSHGGGVAAGAVRRKRLNDAPSTHNNPNHLLTIKDVYEKPVQDILNHILRHISMPGSPHHHTS